MNAIEREKLTKSIIIHGRLIQLTVRGLESSSVTRLKEACAIKHSLRGLQLEFIMIQHFVLVDLAI